MNANKVTLPREVAEDLEILIRNCTGKIAIISAVAEPYLDVAVRIKRWIDENRADELFLEALVNGYEVEKSPEEYIRDDYERYDPST